MGFAPNVTIVTVVGQYVDYLGVPVSGSIKFTLNETLQNPSGDQIVAKSTHSAMLNEFGEFTIVLPATDDSDLEPAPYVYQVEEAFLGGKIYNISVPAAVSPVDISDLRPTDSGYPAFVSYASQSAYDALELRVDALEETVDTETGNFSFPPECQFLVLMGTCDAVLAAYATCDELATGRILVSASAFVQFQDDVQGYALSAEASQLSAEDSLASVLDVMANQLSPFLV